jgi:hypothetical protein
MDIQITTESTYTFCLIFIILQSYFRNLIRKIRIISSNPSHIENINETETEDPALLDWQGL